MRFRPEGRGKETIIFNFKNVDTITILPGSPIFLTLDGIANGYHCTSAEGVPEVRYPFFFGMNLSPVIPGSVGESQAFGFIEYARFMVNSRAASTDSWQVQPALATGDVLDICTSAGFQCVSRFMPGGVGQDGNIFACQSIASQASSASATSDSRTFISSNIQAYITWLKVL